MNISVVVVAHNEGDYVRSTVEAMLATAPSTTEILIVDDQSSDGSTENLRVAAGRVRVLRTHSRAGVSGSRNFGAGHATGDIVVFSDGHVHPTPGWLDPLVDALADPLVGAVAPTVLPLGAVGHPGHGFTWRSPTLETAWLTAPIQGPTAAPMLCGCFLALRGELFRRVGGFDAGLRLWGMEDAELCLRLWRLGFECQVIPESRIEHFFRPSFPYEVDWAVTLANVLRLATVHFGERALARVLAEYAGNVHLAGCAEHVITSDAFRRRAWLDAHASRSDAGFFERFGIEALR